MSLNIKQICFTLILLLSVSSFSIKPLRAGTIHITDLELRSQKIINRLIDIKLSKTFYQAHKDINTIASITSLSMDQNLNFHFGYTVVCPNDDCFLNFTLVRYTQNVNPNYNYRIVADYLIARGLKVQDKNMTSFQEHVTLQYVESYDQNNQKQNLGKDIPFNNEDAWYMFLFPTGFNNLTLTGHVVYNYILGTDMYVIHYMDHSGGHGEHDSQGWPEQQNYIRYRAVFLPPSYLSQYTCIPVQKFKLTQHFEHSCNGGSNIKWFVGLKGTKQKQIQGQLFEQQSGFSYSLAKTPSRYGLMGFPFEATEDFIDLREHEYKYDVQYRNFGVYLGYIIFTTIGGFIAFMCYVFFKPFIRKYYAKKNFSKVKKYDTVHQENDIFSQN